MPRPRDSFDLMSSVARMYYIDKMAQAEIGRLVGLSTSQVSRLIKKAWESGIIQVKIVKRSDGRLEEATVALKQALGLKEVVLVSSEGTAAFATRALIAEVGGLIEKCLQDALAENRPATLGISWGSTLAQFAEHFRPASPVLEAIVVPMVGGVGQASPDLQVNHIVGRVAEKLGARFLQLYAPSIVDSAETAHHLMSENSVLEVANYWDSLSCALVGIGSPGSVARAGYAGDVPFYESILQQAAGDVCVNFFDGEGRLVLPEYRERNIACRPEQLRRIPYAIGMALGPTKVRPILGAIRSGMINCLATDIETAEGVLELAGRRQVAGVS